MKILFSHALSVHSFFLFSPLLRVPPPSRLARVFRFRFRLPSRFSPRFSVFFPLARLRPFRPFSPPFEKALVFFLLLVKRLVRLTQGMSECPTIALFFLSLIRIFLFSSSSLQPLVRLSLPKLSKILAHSPNSSFILPRSRQNQMYTKIAYLVLLCSSFFLSLCPF